MLLYVLAKSQSTPPLKVSGGNRAPINLNPTTMKKVNVFWKGQSKSGNYYIGVNYDEQGFIAKKFIQVTETKYGELPDSGEISVPASVLQ